MAGTILVVEDNAVTRRLANVMLTSAGFAVVEAVDGGEALAAMARGNIDLVLLDLVLADTDGLALRHKLHALAPAVPILAFTGRSDTKEILAAGFADVLVKPVERDRLVGAVRAHLARERDMSPGARGRLLLVDENDGQRRLLAAYLEQRGFDVAAACDGVEALTMLEWVRPKVIVADIVMRNLDGFELCRAVRSDPRYAAVPVVLVSSQELLDEQRNFAVRVGATTVARRTPELALLGGLITTASLRPVWVPTPPSNAPPAEGQQIMAQLTRQATLRGEAERLQGSLAIVDRLISQLGPASGGRRPLEEVASSVLEVLLDAAGLTFGAAFFVADGRLELRGHAGLDSGRARALADEVAASPVLAATLSSGEPMALELGASDDELQALLAVAGAGSLIVCPLLTDEGPLGLLILASVNERLSGDWRLLAKIVDGPVAQALALARTVSRLAASERRFRGIAEATADGIILTNVAGEILYANPAAHGLVLAEHGALAGQAIMAMLPFLRRGAGRGHVVRSDGTQLPVATTVTSFEDSDGSQRLAYAIHDLTMQAQLDEVAYLANHDFLTGLYTRRRFEEEVHSHLAEARRFRTQGALALVDLDQFKRINDVHGHAVGDTVLRAAGEAVRRASRETDVPARLGGDELAVLITHTDATGAEKYTARVRERLRALQIAVNGERLVVTASIGIAVYPHHGLTYERVFEAADEALYRAKREGRDCVRLAA